MGALPAVDPIPLPAPVWLFVALHTLTLTLHFFAVHFLVGGLAFASVWGLLGRWRRNATMGAASQLISRRLPVVMTYVINLGVPPLLFTQVLYGRALYTSSVLIGAWWLSVIALLMVVYSLLYVMVRWGETGRAAGWVGLAALIVALGIAMIYSTNMTLMLRSDLWLAMYRANPTGTSLHTGNPAVLPRWLFMMLGSIGVSGVALLLLALKKDLPYDVRAFLHGWGGRTVAVFTVVQIGLAIWAFRAQPEDLRTAFSDMLVYRACGVAWFVTAAVLIGLGATVSVRRASSASGLTAILASVSFLNVTTFVLLRDGIRYVAFAQAGFDVWASDVNTNWSTVIVFLICFVVALGVLGWLVSVMARVKPAPEPYAP